MVLGYIHIRKGLSKVGMLGLVQPFGDAIKLFTKEQTLPLISNFNLYYFSPVIFFYVCFVDLRTFFSVNLRFNLPILFFFENFEVRCLHCNISRLCF
ncbi:unnamed protein product [Acanthoscelides obtectus]|uniref:NADH-ubiquinone oxidoreductase chain 1 n=1 Tax=Acanthoscelides obtectus TaxID=200917 RepID=A0A9P0Q6B5_ACAOB|nr:unnamed protein product [Acanthoscelides obtectus]CAK1672451.1 NADH-ubiquinone oxidoreductase chain 1 [Acanthoscelides obtectus]